MDAVPHCKMLRDQVSRRPCKVCRKTIAKSKRGKRPRRNAYLSLPRFERACRPGCWRLPHAHLCAAPFPRQLAAGTCRQRQGGQLRNNKRNNHDFGGRSWQPTMESKLCDDMQEPIMAQQSPCKACRFTKKTTLNRHSTADPIFGTFTKPMAAMLHAQTRNDSLYMDVQRARLRAKESLM
mmetsp:Transcript_81424/g.170268  ORF Transcript_81424/g.170268 Transcript_81424/m.170268 type:complete len:180 (+) Transcript_81424:60-599(+)